MQRLTGQVALAVGNIKYRTAAAEHRHHSCRDLGNADLAYRGDVRTKPSLPPK